MAAVKFITSRDNPLLMRLRRLAADPTAYRKQAELLLEGDHLCAAFAAKGARALQAVISEPAWDDLALRQLAQQAEVVSVVPASLMAGLSTLEAPPALMFTVPWQGAGVLRADSATVVLDRLQDAGNVGTILRSAAAFGFEQVIALKGTAALGSPKVLRAGMGAHFTLNLIEMFDEAGLTALRVPLMATSSHAAQSLADMALPWPCAWLMGHEGQGVSPGLLARCTHTLRIPQPGGEESLNVAVAASICLYETSRQRSVD